MTITTATTTPSRAPFAGFAAQLALIALLAATTGLTLAGGLAGIAYGAVLCGLLGMALDRAGLSFLGWANLVTFGRAILTGGVAAMVTGTVLGHPAPVWPLVTIAAVALAMDGVDGQVARRTGTSSSLGARFDMEVDAFLILVLSGYAAVSHGWWALAIGGFRYAFVAASWAYPWLNGALPARFSRKVVAAQQGVLLAVVATGLLPEWAAVGTLAFALASLTWSFGRDIRWLHRESAVQRQFDLITGRV
ncbi:CDP-alcohol phosphatidyltransferase [Actinoplanes sp. SE50]|uniref:CDP-alcohol phosphatidyltransferase family protein n=1 Tax=unclassified Actinoplanes TaxID=2626549 RepID=UPI00023ED5E1|nr:MULTISPECIES: CDP-alcohol phosphatidyltransferase family protein [unclassified Actinoplanes]AEV83958.1 CDP-alcohol phosphatidyltransferase [Actinoplanes sp. SE50/110]ATO81898.1 CDP-alcohol phosphatidyltransferase [Actinoplanes sp. SE50]SLL99306.1 CDP-alcohol phosphatidyltransferase [Actinoplanes sp. SE50/110]